MLESALFAGKLDARQAEFKSQLVIAHPRQDDIFPDDVEYIPCCGVMCEHELSVKHWQLFKNLKDAFKSCVGRFGLGRLLSCADVVLAVEVFASVDQQAPTAIRFVDLREAHGVLGKVPAGFLVFP